MKTNTRKQTERAVGIAIFSALAFVVSLIIRIPVQFLTFDAKDAVITISAFIYGPLTAPITALIAALLELVTISDTGWYGFIMNFASSAVFSLTASLIYSKRRSINGALIGIYSAVVSTTGIMMVLNILITPIYMRQFLGVPMNAAGIIDMIPTVLLPFNFAKTMLNGAIVMLIYKPIALALSRSGIAKNIISSRSGLKFTRSSLYILICGAVSLAIALTIFFILRA